MPISDNLLTRLSAWVKSARIGRTLQKGLAATPLVDPTLAAADAFFGTNTTSVAHAVERVSRKSHTPGYFSPERFSLGIDVNGYLMNGTTQIVQGMVSELADNDQIRFDKKSLTDKINVSSVATPAAGLHAGYALDLSGRYTQRIGLVVTGNSVNRETSRGGSIEKFKLEPNETLTQLIERTKKADGALPPDTFTVRYDAEGKITYILKIEAEYAGELHLDNKRAWGLVLGLRLGGMLIGTHWDLEAKPDEDDVKNKFEGIGFPARLNVDFDMTARGLTANPFVGLDYNGLPAGFYVGARGGFAVQYFDMVIDGGAKLSILPRQSMEDSFGMWNKSPTVGLVAGWDGMFNDD